MLAGKATPFPVADYTDATHWLSVFLYPDTAARDAAAARLTAANIESRPVWKPMHLQPVYLYAYERRKDAEALSRLRVTDCIECGCCAYTCPGRLQIVQAIKDGKALVKSRK